MPTDAALIGKSIATAPAPRHQANAQASTMANLPTRGTYP